MKLITWKDVLSHDGNELSKELDVLLDFVNIKYGIIKTLSITERNFEDVNMFVSLAMSTKPWNTGLLYGSYSISDGNSVNEDVTLSIIGGIGESLERYSSIFYNKNEFVFGSYEELSDKDGREFFHPEKFSCFSKDQKNLTEYEHFSTKSQVYWTETFSLTDKKVKMVPAQSIYNPYGFSLDEAKVDIPISTGMAFGISVADTVYSGLMETVERDAFSIYWLNKMELPRISFPFGYEPLDTWYKKLFGSQNLDINVFSITNDTGIPVFFSVVKGRTEYHEPIISVGAAAHINVIEGIKKSIMECYHTRKYGFSLMAMPRHKKLGHKFEAIEGNAFSRHVGLYLNPLDDMGKIAFCYAPKNEIAFTEIYNKYRFDSRDAEVLLEEALKRLAAGGHEILTIDLTTVEMREKLFHAMKTIVPSLHRLWAGDDIPMGGSRVYEVPARMGFKKKTMGELNTFPHPFP